MLGRVGLSLKIGMLLTSGPEHQDAMTVASISQAFLNRGDEVHIFVMDDAVFNLTVNNYNNTSGAFLNLIEQGCKVSFCSQTARERGVSADTFIAGTNQSSLYQLSQITSESDRFLSFTS